MCDKISKADFVAILGKMMEDVLPPETSMDIDFHCGLKDKVKCDIGAEHRSSEAERVQ